MTHFLINLTMKIKKLKQCPKFIAGDKSELREILNPRKEKIKLCYSLAYARVKPNKKTMRHCLKYTEVYFIIEGKGLMHIDREQRKVNAGDTIYIPPNSIQYIENTSSTDLIFLCIVNPAWQPACEKIIRDK